jgi:REP element-mobilizing transposase RayT
MPEHIHLLMGEPPRGDPSKVLQALKQKVSRALRARRKKPLRPQMSLPFQEGEARGHPYSSCIAFGSTVILGCAFERLAQELLVVLRKGRERFDRD